MLYRPPLRTFQKAMNCFIWAGVNVWPMSISLPHSLGQQDDATAHSQPCCPTAKQMANSGGEHEENNDSRVDVIHFGSRNEKAPMKGA